MMLNLELLHELFSCCLWRGALISLAIAFGGCLIGITLGTLLGLMLTSKNNLTRAAATLYVTLLRGTPMLIQISAFYFIMPELGIAISAFWSAIVAIGLNSAAYISQVIKSGIQSVSKGQIEAAQVLGLSPTQVTRYLVLPQAIQVVLPALGNEFITLVKDSSLASVIGVTELSKEGSIFMSRTYDALTTYTGVALMYLLITTTLTIGMHYLERRTKRPC